MPGADKEGAPSATSAPSAEDLARLQRAIACGSEAGLLDASELHAAQGMLAAAMAAADEVAAAAMGDKAAVAAAAAAAHAVALEHSLYGTGEAAVLIGEAQQATSNRTYFLLTVAQVRRRWTCRRCGWRCGRNALWSTPRW